MSSGIIVEQPPVVAAEVPALTVGQYRVVAVACLLVMAADLAVAGYVHFLGYSRTGWVLVVLAAAPFVAGLVAARKSDRLQAAQRRQVGA